MICMEKQKRLIGLARRAGAVSYGYEGATEAIKKRKASLIIFASDISERTKKDILNITGNIPVLELDITKEELGRMIGTKPTGILSVNDNNFKKGILEVVQIDGN